MNDYLKMSRAELEAEKERLLQLYGDEKKKGLKLDMSRGKPCPEQLDLSMDLLKIQEYRTEAGADTRNYGFLEGIPEARRLFGELLGVDPQQVLVGGNSSLNLMFEVVAAGCRDGFGKTPWSAGEKPRFLCPAPGYDRHFRVTEHFGFELTTVPMREDGPDMDLVEELVKDPRVKGIWCVPTYSNPDGYCYSDETVRRLAALEPAADSFKILWDNAYLVHYLEDAPEDTLNIMDACKACGHEELPILFCSTSKITFPGAGVSALAAGPKTFAAICEDLFPMTIGFDKINQLRHVLYLKDKAHILAHMAKHKAIIKPKFDAMRRLLAEGLADCGDIAHWTNPKGGYFISLYTLPGCAKRIVSLCKEAGVVLTGAGAAYPYGVDPQDWHIRLAPTYPALEEVEQATRLLCIAVRLASVEKLLAD
ncbi:MAG TPA: aminotransferase class I/II-fold pyridoxal phosphate-dependent enzyme [Candidatus Pygmaiobacter gallistercoris]|nr:aminotransferase class I/II-fold pyridoxal phosphate-dependent enzyme [Candidatus Pygmaiobacter gallistercoris]